ncbi:MAG: oligoendopeptidase F [Symbiobacterium thermophilum]|uniref:Oligopeptidase F n=1 Tax=Symbiobacterium thermophilum TaxID=2734 RepID=A0A953IFW9_SYMTR|nr:oligoendopeptidase F [Symbiobacterium thermophilum]
MASGEERSKPSVTRRLTRAEVPVEQTWRLSDLFPTQADWERELEAIAADASRVTQYRGRLGEGASVLLSCLTEYERLRERLTRAGAYASLRFSEDGSNPENQAVRAKGQALMAQMGAAFAFLQSELLALPEGTVERYLAEEPGLAPFRRWLQQVLAMRPHTLHPETESALAALIEVTGAPYVIYNQAKAGDMRFDPIEVDGESVPVSFATYEERLERSADVETRRAAFRSFSAGLRRYQHTLAAAFAAEVKKNVVLARLRGYESATHMLLHPQEVSIDVYHNILDVIQAELAPHMRRYARLRRRVLGLDRLLYCDIEAPLDPGYNPGVTFAEGAQIILDGLAVLGDEYIDIVRTALTDRWIDWCDNVGKSTGAFCSSPYGAHPYILISWADTMRNVLVLAHELGHACHLTLAQRNQSVLNFRPSTFFIEAPSTINELLVGQHIMRGTADPRMRRWVIMQLLATYHHNFVRHLLEGELQRRIYALAEAGTPITAVTLSETKGRILEEFWGGEVEIDDDARLTWMRQPHYYMGLYPYTYSAGLTVGTAVAQAIRDEGQPAVERWLRVLKAGGTRKPLELAQMAGVDLSTPEPIRAAVAFVGSLVDELEQSF